MISAFWSEKREKKEKSILISFLLVVFDYSKRFDSKETVLELNGCSIEAYS
jgi:hypothetical protein